MNEYWSITYHNPIRQRSFFVYKALEDVQCSIELMRGLGYLVDGMIRLGYKSSPPIPGSLQTRVIYGKSKFD